MELNIIIIVIIKSENSDGGQIIKLLNNSYEMWSYKTVVDLLTCIRFSEWISNVVRL